jgi:hypothetical protein
MSAHRTYFFSLMAGMSLFASGCMMESAEMDADYEAPPVDDEASYKNLAPGEPKGIITGNGAHLLTPDILALYTPLAKILSSKVLTLNLLESSELLATIQGRTFLDYVVKCALPAGVTFEAQFLTTTYTFEGEIGLAPEWTQKPLSSSSRRWLTACLLAHVNATAAQVSIMLRGDHPALSGEVGTEGAAYTLREGAFYGDIFRIIPAKHACSGEGTTALRVCTNDIAGLSPCGFTVPGDCTGYKGACEDDEDGVYETCHASLVNPANKSPAFAETITVYLMPSN